MFRELTLGGWTFFGAGTFVDPAYITLCLAAGVLGYFLAYAKGQLFREGLFQFFTSFSLPWYAIIGAHNEPLAPELASVQIHPDRRPLLGRTLAGKSEEELRMLGLTVDGSSKR
jgi:hypothetical protein